MVEAAGRHRRDAGSVRTRRDGGAVVSRIVWSNELSKGGLAVLRGYVNGSVSGYTIRPRADGRVGLADRLMQTMVIHDTEVGAKKGAENALKIFMARIGAVFDDTGLISRPDLSQVGYIAMGARTGSMPRKLTETRRKVLQNVADGNELYHGMTGNEHETAIRFVARWRELPSLIQHVGVGSPLELTDAGRKALETGEY